jgi:hypothetical protein
MTAIKCKWRWSVEPTQRASSCAMRCWRVVQHSCLKVTWMIVFDRHSCVSHRTF